MGASRVLTSYNYGDAGYPNPRTITTNLTDAEASHGARVTLQDPSNILGLTRVQVQKQLGGQWVNVFDSLNDTANKNILSWPVAAVTGTEVRIYFRPIDPANPYDATDPSSWDVTDGSWSQLNNLAIGGVNTLGGRYWVDMSTQLADQYEYKLVYTRPGETSYADGHGTFMLHHGATGSSSHVVGWVDDLWLDVGAIEHDTGGVDDGYGLVSGGINTGAYVDLSFSDLSVWGPGPSRVLTTYIDRVRNYDPSNNQLTYTDVPAYITTDLTEAEAAHGVRIDLNRNAKSISSIQVQKYLNGQWVNIFNNANDVYQPARLLLRGNAGVLNGSGITITNAAGNPVGTGTYSVGNGGLVNLGNGLYAVALTGLAPGQYNYQAVSSGVGGTFTVDGIGGASQAQVVEHDAWLDISAVQHDLGGNNDGYGQVSSGINTGAYVDLSFSDLRVWGSGPSRVLTTYIDRVRNYDPSNNQLTYTDVPAYITTDLTEAEAAHGVRIDLNRNAKSISGIQVQKQLGGQWVTVLDSANDLYSERLEFTNLSGSAQNVSFSYRPAGSSDPYLTKPATRLGSGWFSTNYADIPVGQYNYQLTVDGTVVRTDTIDIKHGGQVLVPENKGVPQTLSPVNTQELDRWGNVIIAGDSYNSQTASASLNTTSFYYDYQNQVIMEEQATTDIWAVDANNQLIATPGAGNTFTAPRARPTIYTYYDAAGRALAMQNPNGGVNAYLYDDAGNRIADYHADGGVVKYSYNAFNQMVILTDAVGNITENTYDQNGRLSSQRSGVNTTSEATVSYSYDEAGNRISITNGENETTLYFYDRNGNIIMSRRPLDTPVNAGWAYEYINIYDSHGHKIHEGNRNTDYQTWSYDYFGRLLSHRDLGGITTSYTYDKAGQLTQQTNDAASVVGGAVSQNLIYEYYENGLQKSILDNASKTKSIYLYDERGNRIYDSFKSTTTGEIYQEIHMEYDELGRLTRVKDNQYDIQYAYDAAGNRTRILTQYFDLQSATPAQQLTEDHWYTYDLMHRITLAQGTLDSSNKIVISSNNANGKPQGTELSYDAAGNRTIASYYEKNGSNTTLVQDSYRFDAQKRLIETYRDSLPTSIRNYDKVGRQIEYINYSSPNVLKERRTYEFNANGQLQKQINYNSANAPITTVRYDYGNSYDAAGNLLYYTVDDNSGSIATKQSYSYTYLKRDSYVQNTVSGTFDVYYPGSTQSSSGITTYFYDANGNQQRLTDTKDPNRNQDLIVNVYGQILRKTQNNDKQYYYYANGKPIGSIGKITGNSFDYNYTPVSESYPSVIPSSYVVNAGDTLQAIALAVYGDASLWYLIADANGLQTTVTEGMNLIIPNTITNVANTHKTGGVYNPGLIIGNDLPFLPIPEPDYGPDHTGKRRRRLSRLHGGSFTVEGYYIANKMSDAQVAKYAAASAQIAAIVVYVVVMIFARNSVAAAMASETAKQALQKYYKLRDHMDIGAIGQAGIIAGLMYAVSYAASSSTSAASSGTATSTPSGGTTPTSSPPPAQPTWYEGALRGAATNVATQAVLITLGKQDRFSWSSVAFAAIQGAGNAIIDRYDTTTKESVAKKDEINPYAKAAISAVAGGAVNYLVYREGKMNWASVAANMMGSVVGNAMNKKPTSEAEEQRMRDVEDSLSDFEDWSGPSPEQQNIGQQLNSKAYSGSGIAADKVAELTNKRGSPSITTDTQKQVNKAGNAQGFDWLLEAHNDSRFGGGRAEDTTLFKADYGLENHTAGKMDYGLGFEEPAANYSMSDLEGMFGLGNEQLVPVKSEASIFSAGKNSLRELTSDKLFKWFDSAAAGVRAWINAHQDPTSSNYMISEDGGYPYSMDQKPTHTWNISDEANLADTGKGIYNGVLNFGQAIADTASLAYKLSPHALLTNTSFDINLSSLRADYDSQHYGKAVELGTDIVSLFAGEALLATKLSKGAGLVDDLVPDTTSSLSQTAIRARVETNIAESAAARNSSNFKTYTRNEYPPYDGFVIGKDESYTLWPGQFVDRLGSIQGKYAAEYGTSYRARAMKPGSDSLPYHAYEVAQPIQVTAGPARGWFGYEGGGIQYKFDESIRNLLERGALRLKQ